MCSPVSAFADSGDIRPCSVREDFYSELEFAMSLWVRIQSWVYLLGAIVFEVGGTSIMKFSQSGHWIIGPQAGIAAMLVCIALSYYMLALAVQRLPVGVAFACWEGLGLTLITLVSVLALGEEMNLARFGALVCVLGGVMLIHHGTSGPEEKTGPRVAAQDESGHGLPGAAVRAVHGAAHGAAHGRAS